MTLLNMPMRDALRLVRAGKVSEATALIKAALSRKPELRAAPIDVEFEIVNPTPRADAGEASYIPLPVDSRDAEKVAAADADVAAATVAHRATTAPSSLDTGGTFEAGVFANAAGLRSYKLWIPGGAVAERGLAPLIVMLHGCTQDADDFAIGTRMNEYAEREGFYVLYPNQSASANFNQCWQWFRPEDQRRDAGEPSILADLTAKIVADHRIDPSRVFVAGLSAGAAMAVILGRTYPDLFVAVGSHSGLPYGIANSVPSALAAMSGQSRPAKRRSIPKPNARVVPRPGIAIHGDRDTTVVPSNSDALVAQWAQAYADHGQTGLTREVHEEKGARRTQLRSATGQALVEQWTIAGAGHAWSGGDSRGTHASSSGPDASQLIVDFFSNVGANKVG